MVVRSIGVVGLAVVLATAGLAAAQSFSVSVTPGSESVTVTGGQSASVSVDVMLQGSDFFCLQPQDVPVTVTAGGAQGISAAPSPEQLTFTIDQGVYSGQDPTGQAGPYNGTQSSSVSIQAPSGTSSAFSAQVQVTATFPGGNYGVNTSDPTQSGGCGPQEFNSAEGSGSINVNVQPDATGGDGGGDDGGGDGADGGDGIGGNGTGDDGENGSPMPAWIVPAGLIGAALIATRRRSS